MNIFAKNIHCGYTFEPPRQGLRGYTFHGDVFLMGLAAQNADKNPSGFIPKKLYSLIHVTKMQDKSHRESQLFMIKKRALWSQTTKQKPLF